LLKKILILLKKLALKHMVIHQMKKEKLVLLMVKNKRTKTEPVVMIANQMMEIV